MMTSRNGFLGLACAACLISAAACSDDDGGTPAMGGTGGMGGSAGTAGTGASAGTAGTGGSAGTAGTGGSAGTAGMGGTAGTAGMGGTAGLPDAGLPDAGGPDGGETLDSGGGSVGDEPDSGGGALVTFGDVYPILVANCVGCHSGGGLPQFAQGNEAAAYTVTQGDVTSDNSLDGNIIAQEIVRRASELRNMPPTCGTGDLGTGSCLGVADAALLEQWVADGALE